jgi:hypothetical protein
MKRRIFIKSSLLAGAAIGSGSITGFSFAPAPGVEVRQITSGDKQHWFGYYDKLQIDYSGRYALGMEVDMIFRSPVADDEVKIGLIDLQNDFKWKEIGTSCAWGWQQGCMLQWIPGSEEEVIWNDRLGESFISRIYNIKTGKERYCQKQFMHLALMVTML